MRRGGGVLEQLPDPHGADVRPPLRSPEPGARVFFLAPEPKIGKDTNLEDDYGTKLDPYHFEHSTWQYGNGHN